jgi:hypothetical protein
MGVGPVRPRRAARRHRGRGYAHLLHDALLADHPEPRATLVVEPGNATLHAAYRAWDWTPVGDFRPAPGSPTYHAMLHDLPLRQVADQRLEPSLPTTSDTGA